MSGGPIDNPSENAALAARQIRESLFDLERMAEKDGRGMLAYLLRLAMVEADQIIGDAETPTKHQPR
jgi:hypothetical protein